MTIPKRHRDTNQLAKRVVDIASGQSDDPAEAAGVDAMAMLGRSGGLAAGVSDRLWEIGDIAKLVEDAEAPAKKRGPYKKRMAA